MEIKVRNIDILINDDEGLSSVFFEYENGYFAISRLEDEDDLYVEKDDQGFGTYADSNHVSYLTDDKGKITFQFSSAIAKQINTDTTITFSLQADKTMMAEMKEALNVIFA